MRQARTHSKILLSTMLSLGMLMFGSTYGSEEMPPTKHYTAQEVQQKWNEAMEAVNDYSADKKTEMMAKVDSAIQALDSRIADLQSTSKEQWDDLNEASARQTHELMEQLQKQRNELAEWYGGLKYGSEDAWSEIKTGFSDAYKQLSASAEKAWERLKGDSNR